MNEKQKIIFILLAVVYLVAGITLLPLAPHNLEGLVMMYTIFGIPAYMFYRYLGAPKAEAGISTSLQKEKRKRLAKDPLYTEAVRLVTRYENASVSLLQRALSIGFVRAARLMGQMEAEGIIGSVDEDGGHTVLIGKSKKKKKEEKLKN